MDQVKRLRFETTIDAPAEHVWKIMLSADTYGQWTEAFCEGSRFEGDWSGGSRMLFLAPSGDGMVSEIAESRQYEFLSIRHLGSIMDGVEDTESDAVKAWAPAYENYTFSAIPGGTRLVIDQDAEGQYEQAMKDTWSKALSRLKQLCEES